MPELPRVLLCSFDVVPGPTGTSWRLSESLRALGSHFQCVALTVKTPDLTHIQTFQGARLLRVPVTDADLEARLETFARAVRRQLESEDYALVHFTDPFAGQVVCGARPRPDYRIVYDAAQLPSVELAYEHLDTPDPRRLIARLRRQELSCLMNADAVITASPLGRSHLESLGVPAESVHLLRTPVGLSAVPRPLPTPGEGLRLVYLGNAEPWQGLEVLLEAVARASQEIALHLHIAGPEHPVHTAQLKAKAQALGLTPEILRIDGPLNREQLVGALADADLGVLPLTRCERNEVTGAALAKVSDYLGAGRGVVSAELPAARAVLSEDVAAFFPAEDAEAMAALLVRLARTPSDRVQLGLRARRQAEDRLGVMAFRRELRALYQTLLRLHHLPGGTPEDDDPDEHTQVHDDFAPTLQRRNLRPAEEDDRTVLEAAVPEPPLPPAATTDPEVAASRPTPDDTQTPVPLDPWQALVLHGYCPPPTSAFSRPTPPTTFPGREERDSRPPSLPSMPAVPSKS